MPSMKVVVGVAVVVAILLSIIAMFAMQRPKPAAKVKKPVKTMPPPPPPPTAAPTVAPTTPPSQTVTSVVYPDYAAGIIPPAPQALVLATPSFILVPGSNFPGMAGQRRDEATSYIITRYPRLVVRAVPMGTQVSYEVRKDRVTLAYDPFTNRVVNARIG